VIGLTKPQKLLLIMFELSGGESMPLQYEDIVVSACRRYAEDFQLRGYPQFPDSSDIHKPLYEMKRNGLVRSANKSFVLTPRGLDVARNLVDKPAPARDRLTKPEENEISRILNSQAYLLFQEGNESRILDTDFYEYLGVSVRTKKGDFIGRLATVVHAIDAHKAKRADAVSQILVRLPS